MVAAAVGANWRGSMKSSPGRLAVMLGIQRRFKRRLIFTMRMEARDIAPRRCCPQRSGYPPLNGRRFGADRLTALWPF